MQSGIEEELLYSDNFDGEEATKTYGSGSSWPYIDQFPQFANPEGPASENVTYSGKGVSVRANSTSNNTGNGLTINSDTPQNRISLETIKNGEYASSTSGTETSNEITDASTSGQHYVRTQLGNSGSITTAQKLIDDYRKNIIMIDRDIIKDLASLFMGIY